MKSLLKRLYYLLNNNSGLAHYDMTFLYVFHTEYIFNDILFKQLISFCKDYKSLTGSKAINTIMTGVNPRIKEGIFNSGITMAEFVNRVKKLSEISTIGYHGHYHIDINNHETFEGEIHCNNFLYTAVEEQMENDLKWFKDYEINHNFIYAPGWYFMNAPMIELLIKNGFQTDYSFSCSKWFSNVYTDGFFKKKSLKPGELFKVKHNTSSIDCIQALIGCHNTPFVEDFERNLLKVFSEENKKVFGCLSVHDDDIDVKNTLNCIEEMMKKWNTKFISHEDIKSFFDNDKIRVLDS